MDTSEQYIKMCHLAILDLGIPRSSPQEIYPSSDGAGWSIPVMLRRKGCIPLYTQDQLQEMAPQNCAFNHVGALSRWMDKSPMYGANYESMEQLWLAFVMQEKFGKVWSGNNWESK